jgi:hypothetical protein
MGTNDLRASSKGPSLLRLDRLEVCLGAPPRARWDARPSCGLESCGQGLRRDHARSRFSAHDGPQGCTDKKFAASRHHICSLRPTDGTSAVADGRTDPSSNETAAAGPRSLRKAINARRAASYDPSSAAWPNRDPFTGRKNPHPTEKARMLQKSRSTPSSCLVAFYAGLFHQCACRSGVQPPGSPGQDSTG